MDARMNIRWMAGIGCAALLLGTVAACSGGSSVNSEGPSTSSSAATYDTAKPLSMKISTQGTVLQVIYASFAQELGYFKDENLNVEILTSKSSANATQALISGSLDAHVGGPEALVANVQGADIRFVAGGADAPIWDLVTTPDIKTLKDLEGKPFGISAEASISTVAVKEALAANGVDVDKVNFFVAGNGSARFAALTAGTVKGATFGAPDNYKAIDDGMSDFGNLQKLGTRPVTTSVVSVSEEWADSHRETLIRFLRAYQRVIDDLYNPAMKDKMVEVLSNVVKTTPDYASRSLDDIFLSSDRVVGVGAAENGEVDPTALQNAANAFQSFGALKSKVDAAKYIDHSYLHEAQDTLKQFPPK